MCPASVCWGPLFQVQSCPHWSLAELDEDAGAVQDSSVRPGGHIYGLQLNYKIRHNSGYHEQTREHEKTQKCCKSTDFVCPSKQELEHSFPVLLLEGCSRE